MPASPRPSRPAAQPAGPPPPRPPHEVGDRRRAVVRGVSPTVDGGRYPLKRLVGEELTVTADVFTDGHDHVAAVVEHRLVGDEAWHSTPMAHLGNDRHTATVVLDEGPGTAQYRVTAWVDHVDTWRDALRKKAMADSDVEVHLQTGAQLLRGLVQGEKGRKATALRGIAAQLVDEEVPRGQRVDVGLSDDLAAAFAAVDPRRHATSSPPLAVAVDRALAGCSAWYELFPRSLGGPDRHGTLADVHDELPRVAAMGFDVLYFPPIHPIGRTNRKGRNNSTTAEPGDVGSPYAVGAEEGGHTSVHPELGTVEDVAELARVARTEHGIDLALDIAFTCSPDHPWVTEHPEWFAHRPDGSIQFAENPPKRYEDIYPLDFESEDAAGLWQACLDVFLFWAGQGVKVFRVDNPHTKSFAFWEWCAARLREEHPDALLLAEAFTRPRVMEELAKRGFHQSYSYFTWRTEKWELEQYAREMFHDEHVDWMRPNFWPNTPDILPAHLEEGTRATFVARLVLAATLNANYGVYGPPYEALEQVAAKPGSSGDYADSEKYELVHRDLPPLEDPDSIGHLMQSLNGSRAAHPALRSNRNLTQHAVDDDMLMAWSKATDERDDVVLVVVSLDPHHRRASMLHLDMGGLGLDHDAAFEVHDELTGATFRWQGPHNYVALDPSLPAHVLHVRPL